MNAVGGKIDRVVGAVTGDDTQERSFHLPDAVTLISLIQSRARLARRRGRLRKSKYSLLKPSFQLIIRAGSTSMFKMYFQKMYFQKMYFQIATFSTI
jgi:hypothetical protein